MINLDRRPDRLAYVSKQLDSIGLPFERFSAIDGQKEDADLPDIQHELFIINQKKSPVRGEIACAASHIAVWKRFLATDEEYALILEDDIDIRHDLPLIQQHVPSLGLDFINLSSNAPYELDKPTLDHFRARGCFDRPSFFQRAERRRWQKLEWRRRWRIFHLHPLLDNDVVCECDPAPALTSGYIISRRAAQAFIETTDRLFFPIDLVWRFSSGLLRQGFTASPIVTQTEEDSDIYGRQGQGKISLKYRLMRPFLKSRRLRRRFDVLRLYGFLKH
nr:glycosyltransferase family 25 protein [Sulfitobacter undariae]